MTDWKSPALLALGALGLLSGCSNSPPKCADSEATEVVLQIVNGELESLRKAFISLNSSNREITYEARLENIRTLDKNPGTGSYRCAGTVHIESNSFMLKKSVDITYQTERTEDSKEVYVTVYGLKI